ncbi:uncharacterized protein LOC143035661 [Oratosquilla oratoria]|uniref:uncharacterized protein LOC143035661 n=1 Tax=Oratosquilla oratoria TaxID=337810 RepID=UPI003F777DFE
MEKRHRRLMEITGGWKEGRQQAIGRLGHATKTYICDRPPPSFMKLFLTRRGAEDFFGWVFGFLCRDLGPVYGRSTTERPKRATDLPGNQLRRTNVSVAMDLLPSARGLCTWAKETATERGWDRRGSTALFSRSLLLVGTGSNWTGGPLTAELL